MDRDLLEQLVVPQPPYRMPRPVAVLAASEGEVPPPAPESLSLAEAIEQQETAVEAAAKAEKEKVAAAPPVEGATAGENEQDKENRERAAAEVEATAAQEAAEARKRYAILEDLEPPRTPEQKVADNALAEKLRAERDQGQAAAAGKEESIDELVARHEKEELAKQPKQPEKPESVNEKISRLAQEAQAKLNTFKDAKPEEVARAKEDVQEVQRRLEAAKRVEPGPTPVMSAEEADRKAAEARAAGKPLDAGYYEDEAKRAREEAKRIIAEAKKQAADEKKKIKDDAKRAKEEVEQQARAAEDKAAEARNAGKPLETGYQLDQAKRIREGKGAAPLKVGDKTVNMPSTPDVKRARDAAEAELARRKAKGGAAAAGPGNVGESEAARELREEGERERIRVLEEEISRKKQENSDKKQKIAELERKLATGGKVPEPEPDAARELREKEEEERIRVLEEEFARKKQELADKKLKLAERQQILADKKKEVAELERLLASGGKAPEALTPQEQLIAQLQQRITQLEAQRGPTAGSPATPEGRRQGPGDGERQLAELGISDMGDTQEPGWWERQGVRMEATTHDFSAYWWSIWAKRAKDSLKKRDAKVKELEKKGKDMAERSWFGTAMNPLVYGPRIVWHKWRKGLLEAAQARHDARRVEHENYRNELLNGLAQQYDPAMLTYRERSSEFAKKSANIDEDLDTGDERLRALALQIARERNPDRKEALKGERELVKELVDEQGRNRLEADGGWRENLKEFERIQSKKNQILKYAKLPAPATHPENRERLPTRQKREPNQPKPIAT